MAYIEVWSSHNGEGTCLPRDRGEYRLRHGAPDDLSLELRATDTQRFIKELLKRSHGFGISRESYLRNMDF